MYKRIPRQEELRLRRVIGGNIKKARVGMGLSLEDVARELGYSKSKLSEMENGLKEPNAVLLGRLAELFLVSPAYFYNGKEADIAEEMLFDLKRVSAAMWLEQGQKAAKAMAYIWAAAFPALKPMQDLVDEVEAFVQQSQRMINQNHDGAWQDMKGGHNFVIRLGHLRQRLNLAKAALHNKKRMDKENMQRGIQQELGL